MILYVRYAAWLHAAPDPASDKHKPVSRIERMQDEGVEPDIPECSAKYLAEFLFEIGPSSPVGMGEGPIGHLEIAAWQSNTGIELTSWEARTLRRLSIAYISESHRAKNPLCPSPLIDVPSDHVRQNNLPKLIRNALRG